MKKENDVEILKDKMQKSALSPAVCRRSAFQQDNNPEHRLKLVQQFQKDTKTKVLHVPTQSHRPQSH